MERIIIFILRIDAVSSKSAAQAIGTIMHRCHGSHNVRPVHRFSLLGKDPGDGAPRWDSGLSFAQHLPASFTENEKGAYQKYRTTVFLVNAFVYR